MQNQPYIPDNSNRELTQLRQQNAVLSAKLTNQEAVIHRYRQQEKQLTHRLEQYAAIKKVIDRYAIVVITNRQGTIIHVSDRFCQLSKYSYEELVGKNASMVNSHYHSSAFFEQLWKTLLAGDIWTGEIRNQAKDGSYFWLDMVITPVLDEAGEPQQMIGVHQDITLDKESHHMLQFNDFILSHVDDAIVGLNTAYRINFWNSGARRLYGLTAEEVLGKPLSQAYESVWIHPGDEAKTMNELAKQGSCKVEIMHRLRSGQEIYVEATTQVLKNEQGKDSGLLAVIRDVTDRRQTEKNLKETLSELKKRNYELDNYVYKVSHDLKAPLSSMHGLLNLIKLEEDLQAKEQYLDLVESRVHKLDNIILSILHHAKILKTETIHIRIDFGKIIRACYEEIKHYSHWDRLQLTVDINDGHPFYSDEFRIMVIVRNMISNAVKYMNLHSDTSFLHFDILCTPTMAYLTIRDNGIGIDAQFLNKIFDMFFRAAEVSEGSGLGLYIVQQAVEKLNGIIRVESKKGKGTTFFIELPNQQTAS